MTPTQRTAALRLADALTGVGFVANDLNLAAALLRELAAPPCACGDRAASVCPACVREMRSEIERLRRTLTEISEVDPTNNWSSQSGMARAALETK